jgi:hypothetical protein
MHNGILFGQERSLVRSTRGGMVAIIHPVNVQHLNGGTSQPLVTSRRVEVEDIAGTCVLIRRDDQSAGPLRVYGNSKRPKIRLRIEANTEDGHPRNHGDHMQARTLQDGDLKKQACRSDSWTNGRSRQR